jgi:hypothetical protein
MHNNKVKTTGPTRYPILEKAHGKAKLPAPMMALANDTPVSQSDIVCRRWTTTTTDESSSGCGEKG